MQLLTKGKRGHCLHAITGSVTLIKFLKLIWETQMLFHSDHDKTQLLDLSALKIST